MATDYSPYVPKVVFEKIPIKNLVSNQEYQRRLSESQILRAVADFDLYQINPVKVSRRDGINYVFDGQHTIEIVAAKSMSRDTPVWCMIYDSLEYQHEAQIFAEQQKHSRALVPIETFTAHLEAGSKKHHMINDLVRSYNLEITSVKKPNAICAIAAVEGIFDRYGFHVLDKVLRLCIGTWEGEQNSLSANMLNGVAKLIVVFGERLQEDLFKERLSMVSPKAITRTAKERHPGSLGFAEAMLNIYNRKCKHKLSQKKLYGTSNNDYESDEEDEDEDSEE